MHPVPVPQRLVKHCQVLYQVTWDDEAEDKDIKAELLPGKTWVLDPELTAWLDLHVKGSLDYQDDGDLKLTLVFGDLDEATHFKLRWY